MKMKQNEKKYEETSARGLWNPAGGDDGGWLYLQQYPLEGCFDRLDVHGPVGFINSGSVFMNEHKNHAGELYRMRTEAGAAALETPLGSWAPRFLQFRHPVRPSAPLICFDNYLAREKKLSFGGRQV